MPSARSASARPRARSGQTTTLSHSSARLQPSSKRRKKRKRRTPRKDKGRTRLVLMGRRTCLQFLAAFLSVRCCAPRVNEAGAEGNYSMSDDSGARGLFDRWERVWHEGQFDLAPSCVAENYIRHDENGDRTVTRDAY